MYSALSSLTIDEAILGGNERIKGGLVKRYPNSNANMLSFESPQVSDSPFHRMKYRDGSADIQENVKQLYGRDKRKESASVIDLDLGYSAIAP